jgi:cysteine synthase
MSSAFVVAESCDALSDDRAWSHWALGVLADDAAASAPTPIVKLPLRADWNVDLYLKDESAHATGSLKHRLARALLVHAIASGWVRRGTTLVEASSGSTAISEAYFARLLGLPYIAVMPEKSTARGAVEALGGQVQSVGRPGEVYGVAEQLVAQYRNRHYIDQFTFAERASNWHGEDTIAAELFAQLELEYGAVPDWIVVGAGTGGTATTLGRHVRYHRLETRLAVVDPDGSAYFPAYAARTPELGCCVSGSRIEGIGRPRIEPSFLPSVVDRMLQVPDAASIAAMRWAAEVLEQRVGGSTGTNLWGALHIAASLRDSARRRTVVTIICDGGERYARTYYDDDWLAAEGIEITRALRELQALIGQPTSVTA